MQRKLAFGIWRCEYKDEKKVNRQITLRITEEKLVFNWFVENIYFEGKEISTSAHWFGDFLIFTATKYFVRYADEDVMAFGEMNASVVGDVKWERRFQRVKE